MDKTVSSIALISVVCVACSSAKHAADEAGQAAAGQGSDSAELSDWHTLVEGAWELAGGEEGYRCARLIATEDLYAQVTLAGPVMFSLPSGTSKTKGTCTLGSDTTLFAINPHMHQLGKHLNAVAKPAFGGAPTLLYDGPFDFNEQRQYSTELLKLKAGDVVEVECTFDNTTEHAVNYGPSSLDEMCLLV